MLEIFAHANLTHQSILVAIHSRQLTNVSEDVVETIGELIGINVGEAILNVRINDELGQAENLTTQVEGIPKATLLSFFGGEGLDGLEIEVVVKVEVIEVLAVNEKVQHVVSISENEKKRGRRKGEERCQEK